MISIRKLLLIVGILSLSLTAAQAQTDWPSKPIKLVVPASAGGSSDAVARAVADSLAKILGQPVLVTNIPGTASILGFSNVAHSAPDGYTILIGSSSSVIGPLLNHDLPYSPSDLAPVTQLTTSANALVINAKNPIADNLPDLVKLLKEKPGQLNFGSSGIGSTPHLMVSLFMAVTGTQMTHIPFKSSGESVTAILGNEVQMTIDALPSALPSIQGGVLKALAVGVPQRVSELPDVPSIREFYPDFPPLDSWLAIFVRAGTPQPIIDKLQKSIKEAINTPEAIKRLASAGSKPVGSTPQELADKMKNDGVVYERIIRENKITAE